MGSIEDIGQATFDDKVTQDVGTVGFTAEIADEGFLGGWNFDGFYQYGHSKRVWDQYALRIDRIFAAVDAVRDANGNIVCNVSTTAGGAAAWVVPISHGSSTPLPSLSTPAGGANDIKAGHVSVPTRPSTSNPWEAWKRRTAAFVAGPK